MTRSPALLAPFFALLALPALAQEGGSVQDLLNNIPTIETRAPTSEAPAEAPPPPQDDLPTYSAAVQQQILAVWAPKEKVVRANPRLSARLVVKVGPTGEVLAVAPLELSGDKKFDKSAVAAVEAAGQLPVPPELLVEQVARGVVVDFRGAAALAKIRAAEGQ